jgi:hypothetical protein
VNKDYVAFSQPEDVDIGEIIFRPTSREMQNGAKQVSSIQKGK